MALLLTACVGAWAQVTTSSLTGSVSDTNGEALIGATVLATHQPSGTEYGTTTQVNGRYTIPNMRVGGPYLIKVSYVGYKEQTFENVFLNLGVAGTINARLADEATELQEVMVTSDRGDIFSAERTGAAASFGTDNINSLPTISRTVNDIVKYNAYSNGRSFAGQDARFNNFSIDGSVFNNGFGLGNSAQAGGRTGTTPVSLDAFDEIQVAIAPYDVRQSGFAGANINVVTRSGTNNVSGSVYHLFRNSKLVGDEVNGLTLPNINVDEKTSGFRVGGPIIKNKLFFFVNGEQFKSSTPALQWVLAGPGATGNVSRVTRADMEDLANFMRTNFQWDAGRLDNFNNGITSQKALVRFDYNINQSHKLAVRYSYHESESDVVISNSNSSNTAGFGNRTGVPTGSYGGDLALSPENTGYVITDNTNSVAVELNSSFGSKIANRFIATYNHQNEDRRYKSRLFPTIEIQEPNSNTTYTTLGFDPFTPNNKLRYATLNISNNFTYFAGAHTITAGLAYERFKSDNLFFPVSNGLYVYNSIADFKAAALDFINNPNATTSPVPVDRYNLRYSLLPNGVEPWQVLQASTYSAFVQDEFQLNERLRLTAGLRADVFAYNDETAEDFTNPVVGALTFTDEEGKPFRVNTGAFPDNRLLLSPRIGFNYDVKGDQSTQIRGGTGIFVSRIPQVLVSNQLGNNGVNTALISGTGTGYPFRLSPADLPDAVRPDPTAVDISTLPPYVVNATDPNLRYPSLWKSSIAIDQRLPLGFIATAEFIYNKTLQGLRYVDVNLREPNRNFEGADKRDRFPTYGSNSSNPANAVNVARFYNTAVTNVFVLRNTTEGESYTATFKVEKPVVKGLGGMLGYTYGQARDIQSVGSTVQANAPTVRGQNYLDLAFADSDLRHRIVGFANYRLQYGGEVGGATMFTVGMVANSGRKFSHTYTNDLNGDGQVNDLIYIPNSSAEITFAPIITNGVTVFTPEQQAAAWDAYVEQDEYLRSRKGQYAERNAGELPWLTQFDVSVVQEFYVKVGKTKNTIQLRADILNFGNLLNNSWGVGYQTTTTQPLTIAATNNPNPTYRMGTQRVTGPNGDPQTVLVRDSFAKSINVDNAWQAQIGIRYIFN